MTPYRAEIDAAAAAHGLDADLVAAVVEQESNGWMSAYRYEPAFFAKYLANNALYRNRNPREVSASYGLMQVMYPTAAEHGFVGDPWELFAPRVNLNAGCEILAGLIAWARSKYTGLSSGERIAVMRSALAAYNGGKNLNDPNGPLRNKTYADEVLARYDAIRKGSAL